MTLVRRWRGERPSKVDRFLRIASALGGGWLALIFVHAQLRLWFHYNNAAYYGAVLAAALWAVAAAAFLAGGLRWRSSHARIAGLVAVGWGYGLALAAYSRDAPGTYLLFLNGRFLAGVAVMLALVAHLYAIRILPTSRSSAGRALARVLPWAGLAGSLCLLSSEAYSFRRETISVAENARRAGLILVSGVAAVYAVVLVGVAFRRRLRSLRLVGFGLFGASAVLGALALTILPFRPVGADRSPWEWRTPISASGPTSPGLVKLPIPPAVFDRARPDLADLRVRSADGREAAYVLRRPRGSSRRIPLEAKLLNRTYRPGEQTSITADFGEKLLKNQIEVVTGGRNFRRRVRVRGSNDGESWETVREGALLFHIPGGPTTGGCRKDIIALPDNNQRYLRITIHHGPEDPEQLAIEEVRAHHVVEEPPETAPVEVLHSGAVNEPAEKCTDVTLDLGCCNLPLCRLHLQFAESDFIRPVNIRARNYSGQPTEGAASDREIEGEPWHHISDGFVYRYSNGKSTEESLSLDLEDARTRYLQVRVRNYDDPPLTFQSARVTRFRTYLLYRPDESGPHSLYFGNESASRPDYELDYDVQGLRAEGVAVSRLGEVERNPAFSHQKPHIPWGHRHRGLVWAGLFVVLGVLGGAIHRQVQSGSSQAS